MKSFTILLVSFLSIIILNSCGKENKLTIDAGSKSDVIYGVDDRVDIKDMDPRNILKLYAKSTAILVSTNNIESTSDPAVVELLSRNYKKTRNLCDDERFVDQPTVGTCSAFLVSKNVLVTAGHCATEKNLCKTTSFVFDYAIDDEKRSPTLVNRSSVYKCKAAYGTRSEDSVDFGIIVLDRPVVDRYPLRFRTTGEISEGERLAVAGYPHGLPLKVAFGNDSFVRSNKKDQPYFNTTLDSYAGNSGSPVFNLKSGWVEGFIVRGEGDFVWSKRRGCNVSRVCKTDECSGEDVIKSTVFADYIPSHRYKMGGKEYTRRYSVGRVDTEIPDFPDSGILKTFKVEDIGIINDFGIEIKARHVQSSDLFVEVVSPAQKKLKFNLTYKKGFGTKVWSYGFENEFVYGMHKFWNSLATGEWKIRIYDAMTDDVGRLKNASLIFKLTKPKREVCNINELKICRNTGGGSSCYESHCNMGLFTCLKYGGGNACYYKHPSN